MIADWPLQLRVEMDGGSREDLLVRLDAQAKQFFGDVPYELVGNVDIWISEDVRVVGGEVVRSVWVGLAYFATLS